MDGNIFFTLQQVNCTPEFLLASYQATFSVRVAVYALSALQAVLLLVGAALNGACLVTLLRFPLSPEVNGHFVSFAVSDAAFLLFNLLDTVSHCVENSSPLPDGPGPFGYIAYVHPIAWTARSVAYTVHCWQTVALSVLKCLRVSMPLSALSDVRLNLLIVVVWVYSLATSIPPILFFQCFVSVLLADCPGNGGFRVAGSGYFAYFSSNRTASAETSAATIPPTFLAINSSLLPACICLVCSVIIVRRLHGRSGSNVHGQELQNPQPAQYNHHHHHRHYEATVARQGREATRSVLLSINSFLIFQIPMVIWTLVDRWFWPALLPSSFSLMVVISNTISQTFFAIDLSLCLHSNRRFLANFRRFLMPLSRRVNTSSNQQQIGHHNHHNSSSLSEHLDARRKRCLSSTSTRM